MDLLFFLVPTTARLGKLGWQTLKTGLNQPTGQNNARADENNGSPQHTQLESDHRHDLPLPVTHSSGSKIKGPLIRYFGVLTEQCSILDAPDEELSPALQPLSDSDKIARFHVHSAGHKDRQPTSPEVPASKSEPLPGPKVKRRIIVDHEHTIFPRPTLSKPNSTPMPTFDPGTLSSSQLVVVLLFSLISIATLLFIRTKRKKWQRKLRRLKAALRQATRDATGFGLDLLMEYVTSPMSQHLTYVGMRICEIGRTLFPLYEGGIVVENRAYVVYKIELHPLWTLYIMLVLLGATMLLCTLSTWQF